MIDNTLQQSRLAPRTRRAMNFLLVDDDELCLFIHRRVLDLTGFSKSTHVASNGKKAMDFLAAAAEGSNPVPDLILLDLDMPTMDGLAFLKAYQSLEYLDKSRIAIVLLTSSVSENDKRRALSLGAVKCLPKPLTEDALNDVMQLIDETKP